MEYFDKTVWTITKYINKESIYNIYFDLIIFGSSDRYGIPGRGFPACIT